MKILRGKLVLASTDGTETWEFDGEKMTEESGGEGHAAWILKLDVPMSIDDERFLEIEIHATRGYGVNDEITVDLKDLEEELEILEDTLELTEAARDYDADEDD